MKEYFVNKLTKKIQTCISDLGKEHETACYHDIIAEEMTSLSKKDEEELWEDLIIYNEVEFVTETLPDLDASIKKLVRKRLGWD